MHISYSNLELKPWKAVTGPSISSITSQQYEAVPESGVIEFEQFGAAYAGVLFNQSCPLPPLPAKGTATFSFEVMTDAAGVLNSQAREFDIMLAGPSGEVYNGSSQLNEAEGGHWQTVNAAYDWADLGFDPGPLPANTWVPVSYTMAFDTASKTSYIESVMVGATTFTVPTPKVIPAQNLKWSPNVAIVQVQLDENSKPGGYGETMRNITLSADW